MAKRLLPALLLILGVPKGGAAQDDAPTQPGWATDVGVAGANIVAGALSAAATAAIRGEDMRTAFLNGAVGGGLVFVGKRVAVERFAGAGLLGRQIASVGANVVANSGQGQEWFSEVWLPFGVAWVQVRPAAGWRARVNVGEVGPLIWAAARPQLRFDLERSLSNGMPVFVAPNHRVAHRGRHANAAAIGGVILLGVGQDADASQRHENVHIIQHDYVLQTISRPLERWGWRWLTTRDIPIDLNVIPLVTTPLFEDILEVEARALQFR